MLTVFNSTTGSSLGAGLGPQIREEWNITSDSLITLIISIYLIGYVVGPLIWGPLSEHFGRKWVMIIAFVVFTIFTLGCALAPNYPALIVFRLFCGLTAAAPITVVGGTCADMYSDAEGRGRAMAVFMGVTTFGPTFGPIVSGFASPALGWRWSFWFGLILAGVTVIPMLLVPETFGGKGQIQTGEEDNGLAVKHANRPGQHYGQDVADVRLD